jgi:tRNA G37 N-methylase TrmD
MHALQYSWSSRKLGAEVQPTAAKDSMCVLHVCANWRGTQDRALSTCADKRQAVGHYIMSG